MHVPSSPAYLLPFLFLRCRVQFRDVAFVRNPCKSHTEKPEGTPHGLRQLLVTCVGNGDYFLSFD